MKINDIEKVRNPIVFISIVFVVGSLFFSFLNNRYIWLAVSTVSLFFVVLYMQTNISFIFILLIFFALSIFNNYNYYNLKIQDNFQGDMTISEKKSYYVTGEYKGRLFYIEGNIKDLKVGEKINIEGKFYKKIEYENGVIGSIKIMKINNVKETFKRKLYTLREKVYSNLKDNIGERKSALICAAAFGYTDNLDNDDKNEMQNLGVIHALSVSGLHVALIFIALKRIVGIKFSLIFTFIYVMITGAAFSAIRAFIMITLLNLAVVFRKKYNPLGAIAFSACLITLFKPYAPYKVGFQLSFLAALGIIFFYEVINKKLYRLPKYFNNTLSVSISAQVFTLPVMMIQFGQCSLLFIVGNLVLLPLLDFLIYLGNIMLIAVYIPKVFDFLSYIVLKIINVFDNIVDYIDLIFSGSFYVNKQIVVFYCFILLAFFIYKKGIKKAQYLPIVVTAVLLLNIYSPFLKVDYLKEGGLLITYRGERKIITNKTNVDMKKLKAKTMAKEGYRKAKSVSIRSNIKLDFDKKNYILKLKDKEYLLRLNNKEKGNENYDIIDFVNRDAYGFYIINDKLYCF